MQPTYNSYDVCHMTGVSYRQLDYWIRCGAFHPYREAAGSGTQRRYTDDDIRILRVLARLAHLGATTDVLSAVEDRLRNDPHHAWPPCVYVDRTGIVDHLDDLDGGGWIVPTGKHPTCCPTVAA